MAENGKVGGAFGEDADAGEVEAGPVAADSAAIAIAMDAAAGDPKVQADASAFLRSQKLLVDLQVRHFDEERRLAIHAAKRKRFADRIRNAILVGSALLGLMLVAAVAEMVWEGFHASGVVVEALSVPPDLAERGLTGQVLAAELQDQLNALQEDTASYVASRRAASEHDSDIKVEIPETGVSLGELRQSLREWLGRETHVGGEVFETKDASGAPALALTVRVGDDAGQRWTGTEAGIDTLLHSAAEKIYASVAPFRFADWLSENGRDAEAVPVLTRLAAEGPVAQMSEAEEQLGEMAGLPFDQRLGHLRRSVQLSPRNAEAVFILAGTEEDVGHEETALAGVVAAQRLPPSRDLSDAGRKIHEHQMAFARDMMLADYQDALRITIADAAFSRDDPSEWGRQAGLIRSEAQLHDIAPVRQYIERGFSDNPKISATANIEREAAFDRLTGEYDLAIGDWAGALASWDKADALMNKDPTLELAEYAPPRALALAKLGRQAEAEALIATTPMDCNICLRDRGEIAAQKGDWPTADRWFAEAARQAPSIPFAYEEWGEARLAKGDLAGALVELRKAHQAGPHWADPLKVWGDVLARQGQWKAALAKYDEALKDAPAWAELRQARDAASKHAGRGPA